MGICTKAIIDGNKVTKLDLIECMNRVFNVGVEESGLKADFVSGESFWISFKKEGFSIFVYAYIHPDVFKADCPSIADEIGFPIYLSASHSEASVRIMKTILCELGGYFIESDSVDKVEYIVSQENATEAMSDIQKLRVFCSRFKDADVVFNSIKENKDFLISTLTQI